MKYGELNLGQIEALINKLGGMDGVASLLADEMVVTRKEVKVTPPEPDLDPIIRVDRSIRPSYPDWMKEVMHPELGVGPAEYDISAVEQWLHDGQKNGKYIEGNKIYNHLKKTDTLKDCLGLRDLEEIQKKGIAFFWKHFKGKAVFGWAGIVRRSDGSLGVPCLCEGDDRVVLDWPWTDFGWDDDDPALRFANSTKA
ncbi:MAG: hypothetical protein Q8Q03_02325 [bacterium]|nr:hypothetical protein [bacterium]